MAVAKSFTPHFPIADNTGPELSVGVRDSLEFLRNAACTGLAPYWNFLNTGEYMEGTYETPVYFVWQSYITKEWVACEFTWDADAQPTTITWRHRTEKSSSWKLIGVETLTWTAAGNLESSVWSGTVTYPAPFSSTVPTTSQMALVAVDSIRTNLMALYDDAGVKLGDHWNYSVTIGTGSEEEPQRILFTKGSVILRGTMTWVTGAPQAIVWEIDTGSGYTSIGTQTFTYSDGWVSTFTWSSLSPYVKFVNAAPTGDEADGNATLNKIREQLIALSHAFAIGILPHWDYSWADSAMITGISTVDKPDAMIYVSGAYYIMVLTTYGAAGVDQHCITRQEIWYSDDSGATYSKTFGVLYSYTPDGLVQTATWDGTSPLTVGAAAIVGGLVNNPYWDDARIWSDADTWSDSGA